MTHDLTYFSTFSGIGGFEAAIHSLYSEAVCIGYSEINKFADQIYQQHYPTHTNYGDITTIEPLSLPDFELLVGGFPCQAFSIAGKRGGFDDTRGTLFFEIARLLRQKQPRLFLLENVKGLLSHNQRHTFYTILTALDELGYDVQWQLLNSKYFGVPQTRERVFIVGHLRGTDRPEIFPLTKAICTDIRDFKQNFSKTLNPDPVIYMPSSAKSGFVKASVGDSINLAFPNCRKGRSRVGKGIARTLDTGMQQYTLTKAGIIRRLTPVECERLQGFSDGWTSVVSDTQRYKCLGNAVTVPVVQAILSKMFTNCSRQKADPMVN